MDGLGFHPPAATEDDCPRSYRVTDFHSDTPPSCMARWGASPHTDERGQESDWVPTPPGKAGIGLATNPTGRAGTGLITGPTTGLLSRPVWPTGELRKTTSAAPRRRTIVHRWRAYRAGVSRLTPIDASRGVEPRKPPRTGAPHRTACTTRRLGFRRTRTNRLLCSQTNPTSTGPSCSSAAVVRSHRSASR